MEREKKENNIKKNKVEGVNPPRLWYLSNEKESWRKRHRKYCQAVEEEEEERGKNNEGRDGLK